MHGFVHEIDNRLAVLLYRDPKSPSSAHAQHNNHHHHSHHHPNSTKKSQTEPGIDEAPQSSSPTDEAVSFLMPTLEQGPLHLFLKFFLIVSVVRGAIDGGVLCLC